MKKFKLKKYGINVLCSCDNNFIIAKVGKCYQSAKRLAEHMVIDLRLNIANKLDKDYSEIVLVTISANNKIVICCANNKYRNYLSDCFKELFCGETQLFECINPQEVIEKLKGIIK